MNKEERLRLEIIKKIKQIFDLRKKNKKFIPGKTLIQYAGSVLDDKEINAAVSSLIDGWFGLGKKGEEFENNLASFVGTKNATLTNSGSSANLLAVATLMSPLCPNHLNPGDEVITPACGFPTTVNPLILYGLVPVFLDVNSQTYNIEAEDLEKALSKKTRAVMIAHALGNPNEMDKIIKFCRANNLFLIEDNCDALGSKYDGKRTGGFGTLGTQSFYPPHHITIGEGGAIYSNNEFLKRTVKSLSSWGRSCWCRGDEKKMLGACGARFNFKIDGKSYDHRYIFNQIGYNLKPIEAQAAIGVEQLKRMLSFIKKRKENFQRFYNYAKNWEDFFILPKSLPKAEPCWFSFILTIKDQAPFNRFDITTFLEQRRIQTRPFFAGNITKQPAYYKLEYRKIGNLKNSDRILHNAFFIGIYPGLGNQEIDYIAGSIENFLKKYR